MQLTLASTLFFLLLSCQPIRQSEAPPLEIGKICLSLNGSYKPTKNPLKGFKTELIPASGPQSKALEAFYLQLSEQMRQHNLQEAATGNGTLCCALLEPQVHQVLLQHFLTSFPNAIQEAVARKQFFTESGIIILVGYLDDEEKMVGLQAFLINPIAPTFDFTIQVEKAIKYAQGLKLEKNDSSPL